jgi:hypothetical protein
MSEQNFAELRINYAAAYKENDHARKRAILQTL